jgi:hypothetical protein
MEDQEYCELGEHFVDREDIEIQINGSIACKDCILLLGKSIRKNKEKEIHRGRMESVRS